MPGRALPVERPGEPQPVDEEVEVQQHVVAAARGLGAAQVVGVDERQPERLRLGGRVVAARESVRRGEPVAVERLEPIHLPAGRRVGERCASERRGEGRREAGFEHGGASRGAGRG
jgi:threonine dehydrogenase-like Zn-dependent dehydrogenase